MDYKLKLMQILDCFGTMEGTWFENDWKGFGVSEEERIQINKDYTEYETSPNKD